MKIDIYTHISSLKHWDIIEKHVPRTMKQTTALWDMEERFRIMDKYGDYKQVLTFAVPPMELIAGPKESPDIARMHNDEMAEIVHKYPDRFVGGVANLPMNHMDAALMETDRAITELGLKGVLVYTNVNGKPLDSLEFMPLYEKMSAYDLPIWIHPYKSITEPDYRTESESKYSLYGSLGWPHETQVAMCRLVCSGVLEKYPNLKFITHHCGGGIPYFAKRVAFWLDSIRRAEPDSTLGRLTKEPIEYLRMFYGDTSIIGAPVLECGHAFFGAEHLVFATDMPYGGEQGEYMLREATKAVTEMSISDSEKKQIFESNAKKLLNLR